MAHLDQLTASGRDDFERSTETRQSERLVSWFSVCLGGLERFKGMNGRVVPLIVIAFW